MLILSCFKQRKNIVSWRFGWNTTSMLNFSMKFSIYVSWSRAIFSEFSLTSMSRSHSNFPQSSILTFVSEVFLEPFMSYQLISEMVRSLARFKTNNFFFFSFLLKWQLSFLLRTKFRSIKNFVCSSNQFLAACFRP